MTAYYKWLLPDGTTAVTGATWPVAVGEWTPAESPVLCRSGWHAMAERDVLTHLPKMIGAQLWRVSVRGEIVRGDDKIAAGSMRLDYMLGVTTAETVRLFACDVAQDVLPWFEAVVPDDPRPRDAIQVARRYTVGEATDAELDAARAAAWTASRDAAGAAARDAAWTAAGAAARAAAGAAAWTAAGAAAGAAAWARYSNWLVVRIESGY